MMLGVFPVTKLSPDASEIIEPVGSKRKFWYADRQLLFKQNRAGTGEDWAEVIAAEVAASLGMPYAYYELAEIAGHGAPVFGVVSRNFCPPDADLVLGNELLLQDDPAYPMQAVANYSVAAHTVDRVLQAIRGWALLPPQGWAVEAGIESAVDVFVGYLMLDALVGNTDRHHENWGAISLRDRRIFLSPTFDHASSLGCILTDAERLRRLQTKDGGYTPEAYALKARSALYETEVAPRPLGTLDAFMAAAERARPAGLAWLRKLSDVPAAVLVNIVEAVPPERASAAAVEFAKRMILFNRDRLLSQRGA